MQRAGARLAWRPAPVIPSLDQTKLATIEASIIGRKLATLTHADLEALERGLREALALA